MNPKIRKASETSVDSANSRTVCSDPVGMMPTLRETCQKMSTASRITSGPPTSRKFRRLLDGSTSGIQLRFRILQGDCRLRGTAEPRHFPRGVEEVDVSYRHMPRKRGCRMP